MPERSSPVGGDQPLARPVGGEPLAKTVSEDQEEDAPRAEEEAQPSEEQQASPRAGEDQEEARGPREEETNDGEEEEKGFLDRIKDKLTGS